MMRKRLSGTGLRLNRGMSMRSLILGMHMILAKVSSKTTLKQLSGIGLRLNRGMQLRSEILE